MNKTELIPSEVIENKILLVWHQKVILDKDIAILYGVATRDINKAIKRNLDRFPNDFMFQLTREEFNNLKFQFGTSSLPAVKEDWICCRRKKDKIFRH